MIWDHQLSRRFGSTSHFRLLNQLCSELKVQPITRDPRTKKLILEAKQTQGINLKVSKKNSYSQHSRNIEAFENENLSLDSSKVSFRDRLNAIDMR